ncbi:MAG: helicase, partial [Ktedonobacteraceae bacterium]
MNVINLPPVLSGELELAALNQRLRVGEIVLNWSQVKEASEDGLAVLLTGLDLVEHSEMLGISTVPEALENIFLRVFTGQTTSHHHSDTSRLSAKQGSVPALWQPEEQSDVANATASTEGAQQVAAAQPLAETPRVMLQAPSPAALRDELEQLVLQDLLGPAGGPEEELDEASVRDRYLVGALAPRDQQIVPEELDELAIPEEGSVEDGPNDDTALQVASLCPSSIGMSFCVDGAATSLNVTASWGYYKREHSEMIKTPKGAPKTVWKRQPMGGTVHTFPLKAGPLETWSPEAEEQPNVVVRGIVRRSEDSWTVTLFLVNEQREPEKRRDEAWVFQPELTVEAPDGSPIFQRRAAFRNTRQSDEEQAMSMLYRQHVSFAIGHGVGVHTETVPGDPTRAIRLSTCVVPSYDVPRTEAPTPIEIPGLNELVLDMKELAECSATALPGKLMPLTTAYATWIADQAARIDDPNTGLMEYRQAAQQALVECHSTLERMREGIALLAKNAHAAKAFTFMNRAMWQQRIHTLYSEEKRRGHNTLLEEKDKPENRSWRPFQLAFILLNIPALTNLHHPDRSADASAVADLLWFPTGGGKTEAYLGLTAYTLAIRRLQRVVAGRSGEDGIAVVMRYTLRLLTLQQFQRATALICACEVIRQEDPEHTWGNTPFRLGLWVGQRTTPNTTEQSEESSRQDRGLYRRGSTVGGVGSPRQLTNCPWCGSTIDAGLDIKI